MAETGSAIIWDLTGKWPVYPGHPLVLATAIMKVFPSYAAANRPTERGWCAALTDSRVPGAGDHVGAAMRVLGLGAKGGSVEAMELYAKDYWTSGQAGGHVHKVADGLVQADAIAPHFRAACVEWFKQPEECS